MADGDKYTVTVEDVVTSETFEVHCYSESNMDEIFLSLFEAYESVSEGGYIVTSDITRVKDGYRYTYFKVGDDELKLINASISLDEIKNAHNWMDSVDFESLSLGQIFEFSTEYSPNKQNHTSWYLIIRIK